MNYFIALLICTHFFFDWVLQPREVAKVKKIRGKKAIGALFLHIILNIVPFSVAFFTFLLSFGYDWHKATLIVVINFVTHILIDWLLPSGNNERQIINYTALDQSLHLSILVLLLTI